MSILFEAWRRTHGTRSSWAHTLGATPAAPRSRPGMALLPWLLAALLVALLAGTGVYAWLVHEKHARQTPLAPSRPAGQASVATHAPDRDVGPGEGTGQSRDAHAVRHPPPLKKFVAPAPPAVGVHDERDGDSGAHPAQASEKSAEDSEDSSSGLHEREQSKSAQVVALSDLPPDVRQAFPEFRIVAHVWNPREAMRFIVVDGRRVKVGESVANGVQLLKIARNGEVVGFRGYRIKLP